MVVLPARYIGAVAAGVLAGTVAAGQPSGPAIDSHPMPAGPLRPSLADDCQWVGTGITVPAARASGVSTADVDCGTPGLPDRRGRRSDTVHFLAYQVAAIAILYSLPESTTGWTAERKENYSLERWWENVRDPRLDTDDFFLNYVTHPYWGAAYFVRSRERGYGEMASFWYAAAISASYEFGAEALFEEPSIQDLIATPVGGWLLGSYFMRVREDILVRHDEATALPFGHRFVLVLTDPLGAINRTVDGWFGLDQRFNLHPMIYDRPVMYPAKGDAPVSGESERVYGIAFTLTW